MNTSWLPATWADVSAGTVVRDVDGREGEVMSVHRQARHRPAGYALAVDVLAPDGTWSSKSVEATNFVEVKVCPG